MTEEKQQPEEGSDQVENDPRGEGIEGGSSSAGNPTGPTAEDVPAEAKEQGKADEEE
jgi:hypothetical protein